MRIKDDEKVNKIYRAAIKVVNRDGFEGSSMSKISAEADVSAATIYLYFENKEDMIKKLFIHLKSRMGNSYHKDNNELTPSKGTYRTMWLNHYQFIMENIEEFNFLENFTNCPLINKIDKDNKLDYCSTIETFFEKSKSIGLIQNMNNDLIYSLLFSPINYLVKNSISTNNNLETNDLIDTFEASWRAISK
ncbi:MAG: TetR/AcrR family transcriptional regulator [Paludibacter sp.]|jgi:AcrR family transcriptional regulator